MSLQRECDRCHKYQKSNARFTMVILKVKNVIVPPDATTLDLCNSCAEDLRQWIKDSLPQAAYNTGININV